MTDKTDMVENRLQSRTITQKKIDALNIQAFDLRLVDIQKAIEFSTQAFELSSTGEFSLQSYQFGSAKSLNTLSELNMALGNTDLAIHTGLQALTIYETLKDLGGQSNALSVIGYSHMISGDHPEAMKCLLKSVSLAQEAKDEIQEGRSLIWLADIYAGIDDTQKALELFEKAILILKNNEDQTTLSYAYNNLALTYNRIGDYDNALHSCNESAKICEKYGLQVIHGFLMDTIGSTLIGKENFEQAKIYLNRAIDFARKTNAKDVEMGALTNLGRLHQHVDTKISIAYLLESLFIATKQKAKPDQYQIHELLSQIYEKNGEIKKALEHHKKFHKITNEVNNQDTIQKIKNIEILYKTEALKKEAEINQLKNVELKQKVKETSLLNEDLQKALSEIQTLRGIIPICSGCKKIRDDSGYWNRIESYIQKKSDVEFSHGMCPDCLDNYYGKEDWYIEMKKDEEI